MEIIQSRKKLFSYYREALCDKQKKPIIDITRGSKKKNIEYIVDQMLKVDHQEKSNLFHMPWDYSTKPLTTETENCAEIIEKEISTDMDAKLDSLKNEMNVKIRQSLNLLIISL